MGVSCFRTFCFCKYQELSRLLIASVCCCRYDLLVYRRIAAICDVNEATSMPYSLHTLVKNMRLLKS